MIIRVMFLLAILFVLFFFAFSVEARTKVEAKTEREISTAWCNKKGWVPNAAIRASDSPQFSGMKGPTKHPIAYVDCLGKKYAIEFEFANHWMEAPAQSLYYAALTGQQAKIMLLVRPNGADEHYLQRLLFMLENTCFYKNCLADLIILETLEVK